MESDEEVDFASLLVTTAETPSKPLQQPEIGSKSNHGREGGKTLFDPANPNTRKATPAQSKRNHTSGTHSTRASSTSHAVPLLAPRAILGRNETPISNITTSSVSSSRPKQRNAPGSLNAFAGVTSVAAKEDGESKVGKGGGKGVVESKKPTGSQIGEALSRIQPFETMNETDKQEMGAKVLKAVKVAYGYLVALEESLTLSLSKLGSDPQKQLVIDDIDDRRSYAKLCAAIIATSPPTAAKYEVEARMWKFGFYTCLESIRLLFQSQEPHYELSSMAKATWTSLIAIGAQTLINLTATMESKPLSETKQFAQPSTPIYGRYIGWLGDLARYRIMLTVDAGSLNFPVSNHALSGWLNAKAMYSLAVFLSPNNGQLYNHLAMYNVNSSDTLGSLHNLVRALNVKVPFSNAHETLLSIFAANRSAYQEALSMHMKAVQNKERRGAAKSSQARKPGKPSEFAESVESLVARVFEILYTRISLDTLPHLLVCLNEKLHSTEKNDSISCTFFTDVTILLLSLLHAKKPDGDDQADLSELQERTLETLNITLMAFLAPLSSEIGIKDVTVNLMESLRLLLAWFRTSECTAWFKNFSTAKFLYDGFGLLEIVASNLDVDENTDFETRIISAEAWHYRGFMPLKDAFPRKLFDGEVSASGSSMLEIYANMNSSSSVDNLKHAFKSDLAFTLRNLPCFDIVQESGRFRFLRPNLREPELEEEINGANPSENSALDDMDDTDLVEPYNGTFDAQFDDNNDDSAQVLGLMERKTHLSSKAAVKSKPLESNNGSMSTLKPLRNLKKSPGTQFIFDTNCYMSHLGGILDLIEGGWAVVVPLVIITELDGLKSGGHEEASAALKEIEPLISTREKKPANLNLITYKGTRLPYLMVRTEDWGVSDDVRGIDDILLKISKELGAANSAGTVILVTGDVNLRLKARSSGVMTSSMAELKAALK
ncbi:hypothetical protein HDU77_011860 [Chytriomyces hyalinus]|nr:hypothetical protein HDU77_011860 [Chytriomyces hyalinus]